MTHFGGSITRFLTTWNKRRDVQLAAAAKTHPEKPYNGRYVLHNKDGVPIEAGEQRDGKPWGARVFFYMYGARNHGHSAPPARQETFGHDGVLNGVYREWEENGSVKLECTYRAGLLHGTYTVYQGISTHTPFFQLIYDNGRCRNGTQWDSIFEGNGYMPRETLTFQNGVHHGPCYRYASANGRTAPEFGTHVRGVYHRSTHTPHM